MKVKIGFVIENSMDAAQIDENCKLAIAAGVKETTAAGQIRDEYQKMLAGQVFGSDINGNPITADVVSVEVFADSNDVTAFSEWHKED